MSGRVPSPPLNYDYSVVTSDTDQAATLLLDAKNEYHKQLTSHLRQPVFNLMKSIYNAAENICHQENTPENILMVFQDNLAQVPKWTKQRRTKEYEDFLKVSKCDWFNELIKFTYVTHVKILTIVNKPRPDVKLSISIPSGGVFFHSVCINVARELWRSPFLFSKHVGGKYEYQKNMRQIEQIIDNSVDSCIRAHIPMKTILQEYLDNDLTVTPITAPAQTKLSESVTNKPNTASFENIKSGSQSGLTTEPESPKPNTTGNSSSRNKKLEINTDDSLDEFINTPSEPVEISQTITNNDTPVTNNTELIEDGLEPISFTQPDEVVDELDIIETAIDDKEFGQSGDEITDLPEVLLSQQPSTSVTPEPSATAAEPSATAAEPSATASGNPSATASGNPSATASGNPSATASGNPSAIEQSNNNTTKSNLIEEFDIDTLPEINLESLTKIAEPNKPTTPVPIEEPIQSSVENTKHIPLTDMNEPGMNNILEELKQPALAKKKLIIEDMANLEDELDEVPLVAKVEELRTIKRPDTQSGKQTIPVNKQNFAFF